MMEEHDVPDDVCKVTEGVERTKEESLRLEALRGKMAAQKNAAMQGCFKREPPRFVRAKQQKMALRMAWECEDRKRRGLGVKRRRAAEEDSGSDAAISDATASDWYH